MVPFLQFLYKLYAFLISHLLGLLRFLFFSSSFIRSGLFPKILDM
jgi:hypothetical protein